MGYEPFNEKTTGSQGILKGYSPKFIPVSKTFCHWFDVYGNEVSKI
mgnify:CR=1